MDKAEELRKFLFEFKAAGYAAGDEKAWRKEDDGSTTIKFSWGDWRAHDNFFGGEPYGGRTIVFYRNKPVWIMVAYGYVVESVEDPKSVYRFLQSALRGASGDSPIRGPERFTEGDLVYTNSWKGDLERYFGHEVISKKGERIYEASYMGGWVDRRDE